jgi:hypothetical protein
MEARKIYKGHGFKMELKVFAKKKDHVLLCNCNVHVTEVDELPHQGPYRRSNQKV